MCGLVGYVGSRRAAPLLLAGLKALEYRGYDSAGLIILSKGHLVGRRTVGAVSRLADLIKADKQLKTGTLGIAHTRWATHGVPSLNNAHPHTDCSGLISIAHNGIIENYRELKEYLISRGHKFNSDTDSEVVVHLIEDFKLRGENTRSAFLNALRMLRGAYALVLIDAAQPRALYAARLSSPLVVGLGQRETIIASDPSALIRQSDKVIYLRDGEVVVATGGQVEVINLDEEPVSVEVVRMEWTLEQAQKGNYPHFMLKEIFEGPEVVRLALRGRLRAAPGEVKLGGLEQVADRLSQARRLIILACGTSYYAGLVGEYLFEEIARLPTEVHFASEFRYRDEPLDATSVVLAISQSGETADTLAALRKSKDFNLLSLGLVNVVGSTIARETDAGVYNHAGPEIGVASTKAFLSQLTTLVLIAVYLSKRQDANSKELLIELEKIPKKIEQILARADEMKNLADHYVDNQNFLFLGRRYNYPTALEGALKLKEVSYIHAEGFGAGEMKHGPIAMIGPDFPTFAIVPNNGVSEKMYSNLEEIRARRGPIIAVATVGDKKIESLADDVFYIPPTLEPLEPLLAVVPLQLFAYYVGVGRGLNVDRPRNLAKSVTVE